MVRSMRCFARRSSYLTRLYSVERRSLEVKPGEATSFVPAADLRITNIALGEEIADENSRTTVKLVYRRPGAEEDDEEEEEDEDEDEDEEPKISSAVLCSLTYGKVRRLVHS